MQVMGTGPDVRRSDGEPLVFFSPGKAMAMGDDAFAFAHALLLRHTHTRVDTYRETEKMASTALFSNTCARGLSSSAGTRSSSSSSRPHRRAVTTRAAGEAMT